MFEAAKKENRYLDRVTFLRAHHPDKNKYNPRVMHEHKQDPAKLDRLAKAIVVEAEVIPPKALPSTPPPVDTVDNSAAPVDNSVDNSAPHPLPQPTHLDRNGQDGDAPEAA